MTREPFDGGERDERSTRSEVSDEAFVGGVARHYEPGRMDFARRTAFDRRLRARVARPQRVAVAALVPAAAAVAVAIVLWLLWPATPESTPSAARLAAQTAGAETDRTLAELDSGGSNAEQAAPHAIVEESADPAIAEWADPAVDAALDSETEGFEVLASLAYEASWEEEVLDSQATLDGLYADEADSLPGDYALLAGALF